MSYRKKSELRKLHIRHQRMRARTQYMRTANRVGVCVLVIALSVILPVTAIPRLKKSEKQAHHYHSFWASEIQKAADAEDKVWREYRALEQDPGYLEIKARERLHWSKPDERVFVFPTIDD